MPAPPRSTASISVPKQAKLAERIDGAISILLLSIPYGFVVSCSVLSQPDLVSARPGVDFRCLRFVNSSFCRLCDSHYYGELYSRCYLQRLRLADLH